MKLWRSLSKVGICEKPRVLAPEQVAGELREYDARFAVIYGEGLSFTRESGTAADRSRILWLQLSGY